jgi:hypothetical protein
MDGAAGDADSRLQEKIWRANPAIIGPGKDVTFEHGVPGERHARRDEMVNVPSPQRRHQWRKQEREICTKFANRHLHARGSRLEHRFEIDDGQLEVLAPPYPPVLRVYVLDGNYRMRRGASLNVAI